MPVISNLLKKLSKKLKPFPGKAEPAPIKPVTPIVPPVKPKEEDK